MLSSVCRCEEHEALQARLFFLFLCSLIGLAGCGGGNSAEDAEAQVASG